MHDEHIPAAPLTEHDLDAHAKWKAAPFACGRCTDLHRNCPTPQACQIGDDEPDRPPMRRGDALRLILLGLASWAAIALTLYAMGVRL